MDVKSDNGTATTPTSVVRASKVIGVEARAAPVESAAPALRWRP